MARFKAPKGRGDPTLGGVTITAKADGYYHVGSAAQAADMVSLGYIDADAAPAPKPAAAPKDSTVRKAALSAIEAFGVKLANPSDDVIVQALTDLPKLHADAIAANEKATEERLLAELAAAKDDKKK